MKQRIINEKNKHDEQYGKTEAEDIDITESNKIRPIQMCSKYISKSYHFMRNFFDVRRESHS